MRDDCTVVVETMEQAFIAWTTRQNPAIPALTYDVDYEFLMHGENDRTKRILL